MTKIRTFGNARKTKNYRTGRCVFYHFICHRNPWQPINTIAGNGKRFIAYEIVKRLKQQQEDKLLHQLHLSAEAKNRERNKKHEVWEDSFDWKECRTHKFMKQKLGYMHDNPVGGNWNLAGTAAGYKHSSARFYISNIHAGYAVMNFTELDDVDLTQPLLNNAESTANAPGNK